MTARKASDSALTEEEIQTLLPLTESTLYILLSLEPGPGHGYGILKDVEALSDGRVVLGTGTLYGALKRLLAGGWIRRVKAGMETTARAKKSYELTGRGRQILRAESERLARFVKLGRVRAVLRSEPQ